MTQEEKKRLSEPALMEWLRGYMKREPIPTQKKMRPAWVARMVDEARKSLFLLSDGQTFNRSRSRLLDGSLTDEELCSAVDSAWTLYRRMTFYGETVPILRQFGIMIAVSMPTLESWKTGSTRKRSALSILIKNYLCDVEASLLDKVICENSVPCMFVLKAHFNYNDKPAQQITVNVPDIPKLTQEEIQERLRREEQTNND